ncbi:DNA polymerase epsilon subunit 3 [Nymphaea thermarum]|nr:DNA polymerase epsilon subunit 3 [Nymphaea thermarum]
MEVEELPRANVRRIVKEKLAQLGKEGQDDLNVQKEALLAFSESARIFIHYLSATANDICKESKRQTVNAEDVFKALEEIEFQEFVGPLRASLNAFRRKKADKSDKKAKERNRKRKSGEELSCNNGNVGVSEDVNGSNAEEDGHKDVDASPHDL